MRATLWTTEPFLYCADRMHLIKCILNILHQDLGSIDNFGFFDSGFEAGFYGGFSIDTLPLLRNASELGWHGNMYCSNFWRLTYTLSCTTFYFLPDVCCCQANVSPLSLFLLSFPLLSLLLSIPILLFLLSFSATMITHGTRAIHLTISGKQCPSSPIAKMPKKIAFITTFLNPFEPYLSGTGTLLPQSCYNETEAKNKLCYHMGHMMSRPSSLKYNL